MKSYPNEGVGQTDFYERLNITPTFSHNSDGLYRGNLFEHKLKIDNTDVVLFQAIKYASRIRERGEKLPGNILLNDLNREKVYIYKSIDFLPEIEQVYFGAASKGNKSFASSIKPKIIDYSNVQGIAQLATCLDNDDHVKYHVDANNVLGLSQQFYSLHPDQGNKLLKDLFLDGPDAEIRRPSILSDRIHPYSRPDNDEFRSIMDSLNPGFLQRELGAFYTPRPYVAKMHEMLLKAISELPEGMDFLVVDRCAGVGNLQEGLPPEILEKCVLSTLEPNEYQLLRYHFGDRCAVVVPNTDALAYDIIPASGDDAGNAIDDFIREKVEDPNCAIILVENPPFSEVAGGSVQKAGRKTNGWKKSFVHDEMAKEIKNTNISGNAVNDLANLFIWSGFRYYLTSRWDSYILYSPTKYWRNQNLVNKKYRDGFLCNRGHFHATPSTIGCIWWQNEDDHSTQQINAQAYDIDDEGQLVKATPKPHTLSKASQLLSTAYDRREFKTDTVDGVLCERNGKEFANDGRQRRAKPLFSKDIVGYLQASSFDVDAKNVCLVRCGRGGGNGFFLRSDNFLEKLPLFVASVFPTSDWWNKGVYSKSYDGSGSYSSDKEFLKKCLIYTAFSPSNKCLSFRGSDGRFYRNELCFSAGTHARKALAKFITSGSKLKDYEKPLLGHWIDVMTEVKKTVEYKALLKSEPETVLGLWQVQEQINIRIPTGKKDRKGKDILVYKYAVLNAKVAALDRALKEFYSKHLVPDLFKYQLLK